MGWSFKAQIFGVELLWSHSLVTSFISSLADLRSHWNCCWLLWVASLMVEKLFPDSASSNDVKIFGLYFEYMLRFLDLILKDDSLRVLGSFFTPEWQVPTSLKCDLPPTPRIYNTERWSVDEWQWTILLKEAAGLLRNFLLWSFAAWT